MQEISLVEKKENNGFLNWDNGIDLSPGYSGLVALKSIFRNCLLFVMVKWSRTGVTHSYHFDYKFQLWMDWIVVCWCHDHIICLYSPSCCCIPYSTDLIWALAVWILLIALRERTISLAKVAHTSLWPFFAASLSECLILSSSLLMPEYKSITY